MASFDLAAPPGAPAAFHLHLRVGSGLHLTVAEAGGPPRAFELPALDQAAFLGLHEALACEFGLRRPHARQAPPDGAGPALEPLLTEPV